MYPFPGENITSVLIYTGEQWEGSVWGIVNKRPQAFAFVLSLCRHSSSEWRPRVPSAVLGLHSARGGLRGVSLHTVW